MGSTRRISAARFARSADHRDATSFNVMPHLFAGSYLDG